MVIQTVCVISVKEEAVLVREVKLLAILNSSYKGLLQIAIGVCLV